MLLTIAIVAAVVVAIVLALAAAKPRTFRVERTVTIGAPPEAIYPHIEDFRRWTAWSPFEKLDANLQRTYGGAPRGKGATYAWQGKKAGAGEMEITEATPSSRIVIRLDFEKPFQCRNTAEFTLEPRGASTRVTWAMFGPTFFIGRVISVFFDMDKICGKDFEAGLETLKTLAERQPAQPSAQPAPAAAVA